MLLIGFIKSNFSLQYHWKMVFNNLLRFGGEAISPRPDILSSNTIMIQSSDDSLAKRTEFEVWIKMFQRQQRRPMIARDWKAERKIRAVAADLGFEGAAATGGNSTNVAAATVGKKPSVLAEKGFGSELGRAWGGTDGLGGELFLSAAANQPA